VIERYRKENELDAFEWYCESCNHKLYKESFPLTDIVKQLPVVMRNYYDSEAHRTCDECGAVMQKPT
jgi:3-hydroxyanthranilate 3,4-dioxygenase